MRHRRFYAFLPDIALRRVAYSVVGSKSQQRYYDITRIQAEYFCHWSAAQLGSSPNVESRIREVVTLSGPNEATRLKARRGKRLFFPHENFFIQTNFSYM